MPPAMPPADGPPPKLAVTQRSTRDRPAKPPLSENAVVEAALAVLKTEGFEAVTMRRVAAELDTGAASLYVYVSSREGLLETMLDRVTVTIDLESPDPARWRVQLHTLLRCLHRALVAHPGIAAMTLTEPPTSEAILSLSDNLLGILLAGGLDPQDASWTCDMLVALVKAVASEDEVRRAGNRKQRDTLYETFSGLTPDRFPFISAHAAQMVAGDGDQRLRFGIDALIDGVLSRGSNRDD